MKMQARVAHRKFKSWKEDDMFQKEPEVKVQYKNEVHKEDMQVHTIHFF